MPHPSRKASSEQSKKAPVTTLPEPMPFSHGSKTRSLLVVDDEKRIADTLVLIMQSKGYLAEAAYDAVEGIAAYRRGRPDLVISDVVMPGMNGVEMSIAIRQEFPDARIFLFSGQAAAADLLAAARLRGYDF